MHYVFIGFQVLFAELAFVGALTGVLYLYWEKLSKKKN